MSNKLLHSTLRDLHILLARSRLWLVFALVVGLFSFTGPFGTYKDLTFPTRLGYWLLLMSITWSLALFCIAFCKNALKRWIEQNQIRIIIGAILSTLPISFAAVAINSVLLNTQFNLENLLEAPLFTLPISIGFYGLARLSLSNDTQSPVAIQPHNALTENTQPAAAAPAETVLRPRLLDRLPVEKRGLLLRLEVQDHYVLCITDKGSHLLLMRLSDAIAETGDDSGLQIHRSHWVADAGIESLTRQGTNKTPRLFVKTKDNTTLPVSRTYLSDVRTRWDNKLKT